MSNVTSEALGEKIDHVLADPRLSALLEAYFDPGRLNSFVGVAFTDVSARAAETDGGTEVRAGILPAQL